MKPPYLDNPFAWLRTPRHGMTPAEFANPIEGFRRFSLWRALWRYVRVGWIYGSK